MVFSRTYLSNGGKRLWKFLCFNFNSKQMGAGLTRDYTGLEDDPCSRKEQPQKKLFSN